MAGTCSVCVCVERSKMAGICSVCVCVATDIKYTPLHVKCVSTHAHTLDTYLMSYAQADRCTLSCEHFIGRYCRKNYDAEMERNKDVSPVPSSLNNPFTIPPSHLPFFPSALPLPIPSPPLPLPSPPYPLPLPQVYLSLLKMYMSPPDLEKQYGICPPTGPSRPPPNLKAAISVLTTYHCQIDTIKVPT